MLAGEVVTMLCYGDILSICVLFTQSGFLELFANGTEVKLSIG